MNCIQCKSHIEYERIQLIENCVLCSICAKIQEPCPDTNRFEPFSPVSRYGSKPAISIEDVQKRRKLRKQHERLEKRKRHRKIAKVDLRETIANQELDMPNVWKELGL